MVWQEMMGLAARAVVARAEVDGSIPDIDDPWPAKDVSILTANHVYSETDYCRLPTLLSSVVSC